MELAVSLSEHNTHALIDLIYDTAVEPDKWPELLHGLAAVVDAMGDPAANMVGYLQDAAEPSKNSSLSSILQALPDIETGDRQITLSSGNEFSVSSHYLLRHFQRALKVAKKLIDLEEQRLALCSLLDRLPVALILVNADSQIQEMNALAAKLIQGSPLLGVKEGRIIGDNGDATQKLRSIIHDLARQASAQSDSRSIILQDKNDVRQELVVYLAGVIQRESQTAPMVALFISGRQFQPVSIPSSFAKLYLLTPKELQITGELVRGSTIMEIAKASGVSEYTVRTQVKAVMAKTNTKRQAELISLVLTGPGSLLEKIDMEIPSSTDATHSLMQRESVSEKGKIFVLSDGRRICYQEYGDEKGVPLVFCHSAVGSRVELAINAEQIVRRNGVRLIIPDRPGVGGSDPKEDHTLVEWSEDLRQLLDHLAVNEFYLAGYALGGCYAMAAAQSMLSRVKQISLISAGMPPMTKEDFSQLLPLYRIVDRLALDLPRVHRIFFSMMRRSTLRKPDKYFAMLTEKVAPADAQIVVSEPFKQQHYRTVKEAFRQGSGGAARSIELSVKWKTWEIEFDALQLPIVMWHGEADVHIPYAHSCKLAARLPKVQMCSFPDYGHFMFYEKWAEIVEQIAQHYADRE